MFDQEDDASCREKCFTTITRLPAFIDSKQIPSKRAPFSTIQNHAFAHSVEAILPKGVYSKIESSLKATLERPQYARVFMTPSALLEHEFFNTYIKSGNILMISEGRSGSDNVFTLRDGVLRMELGKEVFERTGLTGKPFRSSGRKHAKERFLVELNLRLPSMLHGKKGFERIVWAFTNVLTQQMAWLFYDLQSTPGTDQTTRPIYKLHPQMMTCEPSETEHRQILTPEVHAVGQDLDNISEGELQEQLGFIQEWIAMVRIKSPRVSGEDDVDPYLSRYSAPGNHVPSDLVSVKWHGFISSRWVMELFLALHRHTKDQSWFSLSVSALGKTAVEGKDGFTLMVIPEENGLAISWELVGASVVEN
ncbi:uncharacterized protein N7511_005754 [Penicillium nucicola]|uniref:uncharacterized protein n=1 Tax=Penicillium nucicola TaxID=1850975 RepID=UPI0025450D2C|nr:uncharacterized protein N7511_005754 [Penicillium nucicola]KAJ5762372.1 hypothetical protein N7511_005754 [Penicillium nucicola]